MSCCCVPLQAPVLHGGDDHLGLPGPLGEAAGTALRTVAQARERHTLRYAMGAGRTTLLLAAACCCCCHALHPWPVDTSTPTGLCYGHGIPNPVPETSNPVSVYGSQRCCVCFDLFAAVRCGRCGVAINHSMPPTNNMLTWRALTDSLLSTAPRYDYANQGDNHSCTLTPGRSSARMRPARRLSVQHVHGAESAGQR